jgi:glucose/arabinose dehydrogenase/mono/diheme cytochrome c family protein
MKWGLWGGLLLGSLSSMAQLIRVANNTLNMPASPPVYGYSAQQQFGRTFIEPVALATPPDGSKRLFIVEQIGRIYAITNLQQQAPVPNTFLDIRSRILLSNERGLLGLAFHPNYSQNGYFYVFYVAAGSGNDRLSRFQVSASDPNVADPNSEVILIDQPDDYDNHNAGDLHFGTDGYLYVSLGDEGGAGDSGNNSQRIDKDFFSGILRIDVDKRPGNLAPNPHPASSANYSVPADNPFVGATSFNGIPLADPSKVRTEFWAVGLRNPWRFSFDSLNGALWCGDVGQGLYEEVDVITKGGNYGWNYREGLHPFGNTQPPAGFQGIDPVYEYPHANGNLCIIGGVVYRGSRISQLYGAYIFADYAGGSIWALRLDSQGKAATELLTSNVGTSAFGFDPSNGDLLICNVNDGWIRRLVYSATSTGTPLPPTLAETGAFSDLANLTPNAGIVPYDINLPFWSDGASKTRWFSIPDTSGTFAYKPTDTWTTPVGAVWIKHFDMQTVQGDPSSTRRLETRFIVRNSNGIYGVTYRWTDQTSAVLVPEEGMDEALTIRDAGGIIRTQIWHYPARSECLVCHNATAGWVLGMNSPQLNRNHAYGSPTDNQITALQRAGYLSNTPDPISSIIALAKPDDASATLEFRLRSYLAANCSQCHRPGGMGQGYFDTRIATPTDQANLINGPLVDTLGDPANRTLVLNSPEHSVILRRMSLRGATQMPPLASNISDQAGVDLVRSFIGSQAQAQLTITVDNKTKVYGSANPTLTVTYSGFVNGDGPSVVSGLVLSTTATASSGVGAYAITASGATAANYTITYVNGALNVTPAPLTIAAQDKSKVYGAPNPVLTATYTGFVNGDTSASLDTPVSFSTAATQSSSVGNYAIRAQGASDLNYSITFVDGTLTVAQAPLTVRADDKAKVYGTANPPLTASYVGFVNGDTPSAVSGLALSTSATASSGVGAYAITASGATAANYAITYVNGALNVTPAPLTIAAQNKSKIYGAPNPVLTATYTGFVNGDTSASLDTPVSFSTAATQSVR